MNAEGFRAEPESGKVPIDNHHRVLREAFKYMIPSLNGRGVFGVVKLLHDYGYSFGKDINQMFNRTLDLFYLAQIAAGTYRSFRELGNYEAPFSPDDFDWLYSKHRRLLYPEAWREYYTPVFLASPTSVRFYRLPNLQDLPDSGPTTGHSTKLPRWAHNVARTHREQPVLFTSMYDIALSTLQQSIERLRWDRPDIVHPYSATQAKFWLSYMMGYLKPQPDNAWDPKDFSFNTMRRVFDLCVWQVYYSQERWDSADGGPGLDPDLKPDLDDLRKSEEPEVGSEEQVAFLAEVAVRQADHHIDGSFKNGSAKDLDYTLRSHILLGLLLAAFETKERGQHVEELKLRVVEAGRLDEHEANNWLLQALKVVGPYIEEIRQHGTPISDENWKELLRRILVENGQLFARWRLSPTSKEYSFALKPRPRASSTPMEGVQM
ncbi:rta1 domain protein [Colletotrichum sojae]|uniref:Rta1 domain protein n=1 Tax=Colletotrichum sojae TaxID=2175907 RepID=A0A8H6IYF7_9PEZI|nr:rta1 domain protein [Colletotrichum sojae]